MRLRAWIAVSLLVLAGRAHAAGVHVQLSPATVVVAPGDTVTVQAIVTPADAAFNAFDLTLHFDPVRLTFLPQVPVSKQLGSLITGACAQVFHVFTPSTDSVTASVSLLCANKTMTGPGTIYSVKFVASPVMQGTTTVTCGAATQFYAGGVYVNPVECTASTIHIGAVGVGDIAAPVRAASFDSVRPSPRAGRGPVTLSVTLPSATLVRADIVDVRGRVVARRAPERLAAGAHDVAWRVPHLAAGAYVVRVHVEDRVLTRTWAVTP